MDYLSFEDLDFKTLKIDAMLTSSQNYPGPLFRNSGSPKNIPRIAKTHTLTDKKVVFPVKSKEHHPMGHFNAYFASGRAAFRGSWEDYIKLHPSTLTTLKIFETGSPRTDILFAKHYDRREVLEGLGLDPKKKTVLFAPTFQKNASLELFGIEIIEMIASLDVNLLVHLHFMSLDRNFWDAKNRAHGGKNWAVILNEFERHSPNMRFVEGDSNAFFVASDLLVGDVSGACFEFMVQNRPVVFIDIPEFFEDHGTKGVGYWGRQAGDIIKDISNLSEIIQLNLSDPNQKESDRLKLIAELIFNPGKAAKVAVDTIERLIKEPTR